MPKRHAGFFENKALKSNMAVVLKYTSMFPQPQRKNNMLKQDFTFGTISGIKVGLSWSFLGLLVAAGLLGGLPAVAFFTLLFASVLVHELGHAFTAQHLGFPCKEITLHVAGGIAYLKVPREPKYEFIIAIAGPAVSLAIAGVAFGANELLKVDFLETLFYVNLILGLFNLVPAFPTDGGRVLRAGLASLMGFEKATNIVVVISFVVCAFGLAYAIYDIRPMLGFVSILLAGMALAEKKSLQQEVF